MGVELVLSFAWRPRVAPRRSCLSGHEDTITGCVICPEDKYAVSSSQDSTCRVWEIRTGKCAHTLEHDDPVTEIKISKNGQFVISSTGEWLYLWNIRNGKLVKKFATDSHLVFRHDKRLYVYIMWWQSKRRCQHLERS